MLLSSFITWITSSSRPQLCVAVVVDRHRIDSVLLFDLLDIAQPEGSLAAGSAHIDCDGDCLAACENVFVAVLPHLDLKALYGPFYVSVGLIFWAYVSGLILFAGAQFSVARYGNGKKSS